ncbi:hypothetical protein LCGC14_2566640 [marine sediment metagenome]|uniref:ABC transporter domain-containing protein n=1 Tax=marine sediment metagenome TaxID=412755 RepID=A0A0F9CUL4_9ZZZZ
MPETTEIRAKYGGIEKLPDTAKVCADLLAGENGFDHTIEVIRGGLPEALRETAYALACDIAAADGEAKQEELRVLELLRHGLDIERLAIPAGRITAIRGANGAGKTTLLEIIALLCRPTRGEVRLWGRAGRTADRALRRRCVGRPVVHRWS